MPSGHSGRSSCAAAASGNDRKNSSAIIGTRRIDAEGVTRLSMLPPREQLLAQVAGSIASPLSSMASLLSAPLRNLAYAMAQLRDQREGPLDEAAEA